MKEMNVIANHLLKIIFLALLILSPLNAFADYQMCDIFNGHPNECSGWYSGKAVIKTQSGDYQMCHIYTGNAGGCSGLYTGKAVIDYP